MTNKYTSFCSECTYEYLRISINSVTPTRDLNMSRPRSRSDPIGESEPVSGAKPCTGTFFFFFFQSLTYTYGIQLIFVITNCHLHI